MLHDYYNKPYEHWNFNEEERTPINVDYALSETADCDQDIKKIIPKERRRLF